MSDPRLPAPRLRAESMSDALREKLKEADAACPCEGMNYAICRTEAYCACCPGRPPYSDNPRKCLWPGHAAIRAVARAAAELAFDAAASRPYGDHGKLVEALNAILEEGERG